MKQTVSQNDFLAKQAIEEGLGVSIYAPFVGLIVADDSGLCAALIFNGFDRQNVDLSIIALRPLTIRSIRDIARYVFCRMRCKRVTCVTAVDNHKAINRLFQLGFECEGRLSERFPSGDAFIFGLLASRQKILRLTCGFDPQPTRPLRDGGGSNTVERADGELSVDAQRCKPGHAIRIDAI